MELLKIHVDQLCQKRDSWQCFRSRAVIECLSCQYGVCGRLLKGTYWNVWAAKYSYQIKKSSPINHRSIAHSLFEDLSEWRQLNPSVALVGGVVERPAFVSSLVQSVWPITGSTVLVRGVFCSNIRTSLWAGWTC
jgi:hypothetical protein